MKDYYKQILHDVAVDLSDEFDQNFERKAFFNKKWKATTIANRRGSLMIRTSALRRSIQNRIMLNSISWSSSQPSASIHNEGGEITVTAKMKKFFWAKHIEAKKASSLDADMFKGMAMKKVGSKIIMPERRYIGDHPEVRKSIEKMTDQTMVEIDAYFTELLRQK